MSRKDTYPDEYRRWLECTAEQDLRDELLSMTPEQAADAFRCDLEFGTGGIRGVIGAGTNRMNVHTVAKVSRGLADWLNRTGTGKEIVLAYDTRYGSERFCRTACEVFAANGIRVHAFGEPMPTPCLAYAVRALGCAAGVMITASHNPAEYNGYKVYGPDGGQITEERAEEIRARIGAADPFSDVKGQGNTAAGVSPVPGRVYDDYMEEIGRQSVLDGEVIDRSAPVAFTPLHGTGFGPVMRALREAGFENVLPVTEQAAPDGAFPTCPSPNPEERAALEPGIRACERTGADLLIATDPDADRCAAAVRENGGFRLLTGNETGILLLDFICSMRSAHGRMPAHPVVVKTIVTTPLADRIAAHYGAETVSVLTGFKHIGEVVGRLEQAGRKDDFVFGLEESCGYLTGSYVRDKDGVCAARMIAEMFAYHRAHGVSLTDRLEELRSMYGRDLQTLRSYRFEGIDGVRRMRERMRLIRGGLPSLGGKRVVRTLDYEKGVDGLPPADVVRLFLEDGSEITVRPSGTEPKLKAYLSVCAAAGEDMIQKENRIAAELEERIRGTD